MLKKALVGNHTRTPRFTETHMQIVDAEFGTLKSAARRGRARSAETVQLIEAIESLQPGQAKAVMVESDATPEKVRARIMYAAKAADRKLQIAVSGDRVMFALKNGRRLRSGPRRAGAR